MKALEELFDTLLISIATYPTTIWKIFVAPSKLITELKSRTSPGITYIFSVALAQINYEKINISGSMLISHIVIGAITINLQRFVLNLCKYRKDNKPSITTDLHLLSYAYSAGIIIYVVAFSIFKIVNLPNIYVHIGSSIFYFWPLFNMIRIQIGEGNNYQKALTPTIFAYTATYLFYLLIFRLWAEPI